MDLYFSFSQQFAPCYGSFAANYKESDKKKVTSGTQGNFYLWRIRICYTVVKLKTIKMVFFVILLY